MTTAATSRLSLRTLLVSVTLWCVFLGYFASILWMQSDPYWVNDLITLVATVGLLISCNRLALSSFRTQHQPWLTGLAVLWPLLCLTHWCHFLIAADHAFGSDRWVAKIMGPFSWAFSTPLVELGNALPFSREMDLLLASIIVAFVEACCVCGCIAAIQWRYRLGSQRA